MVGGKKISYRVSNAQDELIKQVAKAGGWENKPDMIINLVYQEAARIISTSDNLDIEMAINKLSDPDKLKILKLMAVYRKNVKPDNSTPNTSKGEK